MLVEIEVCLINHLIINMDPIQTLDHNQCIKKISAQLQIIINEYWK